MNKLKKDFEICIQDILRSYQCFDLQINCTDLHFLVVVIKVAGYLTFPKIFEYISMMNDQNRRKGRLVVDGDGSGKMKSIHDLHPSFGIAYIFGL